MTLEWTVTLIADFPDDVINRLCDMVQEEGYDERKIIEEINNEISGWEDDIYYQWGTDQTKAVINAIKQRTGGIQISMFDDVGQ